MDHSRDKKKDSRRNKIHAKAKKTGSGKLRTKFESLRREITADIKMQHDLYVNNFVGDVTENPRDFYRCLNSPKKKKKKKRQDILPLIKREENGVAELDSERAEELIGQFNDAFSKTIWFH